VADGISHISTFSLYPGKNLGAYGDAGIITTNNLDIFKRLNKIRNIGASKKFNHETLVSITD
jgi:dTDP-4-amino-4,6-dideoxygalactose transaminase